MTTQIEQGTAAAIQPPPPELPELVCDALKQVEFTKAVKVWAAGSRTKSTSSQHLISFGSAIDLVNAAIEESKTQIDIPLVPHLAVLGLRKELEEFSLSITGSENLPKPTPGNSGLLTKISGSKGVEIKLDESKIKNEEVICLLGQLREALPDLSVTLYGKWNFGNESNLPQHYIRISLKNSELATVPDSPIEQARLRARESLALPAEADDRYVEIERQNKKAVAKFRELLHERHKQLLKDPLSLNSGVLISDRDSPLQISEIHDRFSHYHLNKVRLALEILVGSALLVPSVTLGLAGAPWIATVGLSLMSGFTAWAIGGMSLEDRGLKRMRATDPLNTIQSPSIKALIKEIGELGYFPKLKNDSYSPYNFQLEVHTAN